MIIAALLIICTVSNTVYAASKSSTNNNKMMEDILEKIGQKKVNIGKAEILYDINENQFGKCYDIDNTGYVITDNDGKIVEFSFTKANPYGNNKNDKKYYSGPLGYMTGTDEEFIDLNSHEKIQRKELKERLNEIDKERPSQVNSEPQGLTVQSDTASYATSPTLSGRLYYSLQKWNYNTDGTCGALAAAIAFDYIDTYIDYRWVPYSYTGQSLYNELKPYIHMQMGGGYIGADRNDVCTGINQWMTSKAGYYKLWSASGFSWDTLVNEITNHGHPVLLAVHNHSTYGEHWVIGHGYNAAYGYYYGIVNDGWGSNDVYLDTSYFSYWGMVYYN